MFFRRGCLWLIVGFIALTFFQLILDSLITSGLDNDSAMGGTIAIAAVPIVAGILVRRKRQRKSNRPTHENLFAQRGKKSRSLNLPLTDYQDLPRLEAPAGYVYVIQERKP